MDILLDASTFFSFLTATESDVLDAEAVYNMANFLECLVVADTVYLAPTTLTSRAHKSPLLAKDGPCKRLLLPQRGDEASGLFKKAITESLKDLVTPAIRGTLPLENYDVGETQQLLEGWMRDADRDPRGFMDTYSEVVWLTDAATSTYFREVYGDHPSRGPSHDVAHYLLRSNVALELSQGSAYHPHSHRTQFVCKKLKVSQRASEALASGLVGEAERMIGRRMLTAARSSFISNFGGFRSAEPDMPLVLAIVLSGARKPDDMVRLTLEIRNTAQAVRYRRWTTRLLAAIRKGDPVALFQAEQEVTEARRALTVALAKLYGSRRSGVISSASAIAGAVDAEDMLTANWKGMLIKAAKKGVESTGGLSGFLQAARVRHKVALLITLVKGRSHIGSLNALLGKVFGKTLDSEQLEALHSLRLRQGRSVATLLGRKRRR